MKLNKPTSPSAAWSHLLLKINQLSGPTKRKLGLGLVLLLVIGAAGAVLLVGKDKNDSGLYSKTVTIPADWKPVKTEFGTSVKAPADWSAGSVIDSTVNNLEAKSVMVSKQGSTPSDPTVQGSLTEYVNVGTQQRTDDDSQAAFERQVGNLNRETMAALESFGIAKEKVKITSRKLILNGKPWLEVNTDIPGQYSKALYYWTDDHATSFSLLNPDKTKLGQMSEKYLYPVAASLTAKD